MRMYRCTPGRSARQASHARAGRAATALPWHCLASDEAVEASPSARLPSPPPRPPWSSPWSSSEPSSVRMPDPKTTPAQASGRTGARGVEPAAGRRIQPDGGEVNRPPG
eukprot:5084362-Pyramimonas_sp.AAC.1